MTLFICLATRIAAQDLSLIFPVACTIGTDCRFQQFTDHDPTQRTLEFRCGTLTYDGHKGTDIALTDLAAQSAGVDVFAAAEGTVRGMRNDMPDILQGTAGAPVVTDRECGNGVVIAHEGGFETQYCHLRQGSVTVLSGDAVKAGQVIGQIGLSGQTEFPHLHLSVRQNGSVIDPFDPDGQITCGAPDPVTLWSTPQTVSPGGIISTGWANEVPAFDAIKAGTANRTALAPTDALVAWVYLFGTQAGDRLDVRLIAPDGSDLLRDLIILDRTQAQSFRAFGKRAPSAGWRAGTYTAQITHLRRDTEIDSTRLAIPIGP